MSANPTPLPDAADRAAEEQPPELPRFRFSLQTLFVGVAALCLLLAAMVAAGPIGAFVLLMAAISVVAHIFSTALGKSLRDATSERISQKPPQPKPIIPESVTAEAAWQHRPWAQDPTGPIAGALTGAIFGGALLAWVNWEQATIANVSLGAFAFATLGGIGGFAMASFWRAVSTSWESSLRASETKQSKKPDPPTHHGPSI